MKWPLLYLALPVVVLGGWGSSSPRRPPPPPPHPPQTPPPPQFWFTSPPVQSGHQEVSFFPSFRQFFYFPPPLREMQDSPTVFMISTFSFWTFSPALVYVNNPLFFPVRQTPRRPLFPPPFDSHSPNYPSVSLRPFTNSVSKPRFRILPTPPLPHFFFPGNVLRGVFVSFRWLSPPWTLNR